MAVGDLNLSARICPHILERSDPIAGFATVGLHLDLPGRHTGSTALRGSVGLRPKRAHLANPKMGSPNSRPTATLSPGMRFFLIDKITRWEVGALAEGVKSVALSEDFFDDHFPRRPVMPGVLILEGMAQLSGVLLESSLQQKHGTNAKAVLTVLEKTKFRTLVKPGDTLHYRTEVMSVNEAGGKVKTTASRGETVVTSTEMVFAFTHVDDPLLEEKRRRLMDLWMKGG